MGKYTIAKALTPFGFLLLDNQLVNNPIFSLLGYDGFNTIPEEAWDAVKRVRDIVLNFMARQRSRSYVLTNNLYDDEGDRDLYAQVKEIAEKRGSLFVPVRLQIDPQEHMRRVTQPGRRDHLKSIDPQEVYDEKPLLPLSHPNFLALDVTHLSAQEAAQAILTHLMARAGVS